MDVIKEEWVTICASLRIRYNLLDTAYTTWIAPLEYYKTEGNTVYIFIDDDQKIHQQYITKSYSEKFSSIIYEVTGINYSIEFIRRDEKSNEDNAEPSSDTSVKENKTVGNLTTANLNPEYRFENFVVGNNNKLAYSACLAVAETPGEVYNPLYIYGHSGLGKTHLMHSIGHMILENDPNKKIIYVTSEEFINEVVENMRAGDALKMSKIREKYRTVDVLMVDDIQYLIGKDRTQEEFFHTFNTLHEAHKQIVISSDKPPKEINDLDERFTSRFACGIIVDIGNPDYETRVAILRKNAEKLEKSGKYKITSITDEAIQYIATNIKSNIRELEGALNLVFKYADLLKEEATIEVAEEALKDMINPKKPVITSSKIIDVVSEIYEIKTTEILSQKRNQEYAVPRMVVMYLCFDILSMSYSSIAKLLNKKDHTTIIHGVNKIKDTIGTDEDLKNKIEAIRKKLN